MKQNCGVIFPNFNDSKTFVQQDDWQNIKTPYLDESDMMTTGQM